jgi:protein phosphatase
VANTHEPASLKEALDGETPLQGSIGGLRVGSLTDVGKVREINQDYLASDPDHGLFIVADGMGGHLAGEKASQGAVEAITRALTPDVLAAANGSMSDLIQSAIQEANREIVQASLQDSSMRGMGTTATVAVTVADKVYVGHIGDSRAYHLRGGEIVQITEDHSVVAQLLRARAITPAEAQRHPYRNVITRCLGMQMEIEADTFEVDWQIGDRLLLCSDGLSGLVSDEEMAKITVEFPEPQAACERLVALALERGGYDNVTVVLLAKES